jgi:hypothetical protein
MPGTAKRYVTLGSKVGSFLIVGTKNDVRYFGEYVILGIRYSGSRLYFGNCFEFERAGLV